MKLMKMATAMLLSLTLVLAVPGALADGEMTDGIYEATAPGMNGDITARVVVLDGELAMITAKHDESPEVGGPAIDELIRRAMEAKGPEIDAVAGATETSEAFKKALRDAMTQAGWVEPLDIHIIYRRTPEPVAEVSTPEIGFGNTEGAEGDVALITGDFVSVNWRAEGEVQTYHLEIADEVGTVVKGLDINDTQYFLPRSELAEGRTYTLTVTAVPKNGTLEEHGVSASARFAVYAAPTPKPVQHTGEISDSWEEIIAAIDDGSAKMRYAVGATKELDLGELGTVHMQLAGFDLDDRADGNGNAATTWIAVELLPEEHVMNSEDTTEGGWRDSEMRAYLNDTVYPALPGTVQNRLVLVKKQQKYRGEYQTTEDRVWIPSNDEIFDEDSLYYGLFQDSSEKRIKQKKGSASSWWLRSVSSYHGFFYVYTNGFDYYYNANDSYGVALGFCL